MIYLDYSANTPADPEVLDAFCSAERTFIGNANSNHVAGQQARSEMERAVQTIAARMGALPEEVILTSGVSGANNLAIDRLETRRAAVQAHHDRLRAALSAYPKVRINSPADAVPHILNLSVEGVRGAAVQRALSARGVCVSVKHACSVENTPSRAVYAVSHDRMDTLCSWRISLSHRTTAAELDAFLSIFDKCYREGFSCPGN